jgi:hypothetical protein
MGTAGWKTAGLRATTAGHHGSWWLLLIIEDIEREGTRMVRPERFELPT